MKKPKPGDVVTVRWLDSGLSETGDPRDPRVGVLATPEAHGRVLSCEPCPELSVRKGMDTTTLKLLVNSFGLKDSNSDIMSIWWPSVVSISIWKS